MSSENPQLDPLAGEGNEWTRSLIERIAELEQELEAANQAAEHDVLTGLLNRRGYESAMRELIKNQSGRFALVVADLDDLKKVNDTEGPDAGDELIRKTGKAISDSIRGEQDERSIDMVAARHGGDEFAILLPMVDNNEDLADIIKRLEEVMANEGIGISIDGLLHTEGQTGGDLFEKVTDSMKTKKKLSKQEKAESKSPLRQLAFKFGLLALKAADVNTSRLDI